MASKSTRDHEEIRAFAERHGARPTIVSRTGGMLRFEFSPKSAQELEPVDWDEFFQIFDDKGLTLLYDDKPGSRFHKFVYEGAEAGEPEASRKTSARSSARTSAQSRTRPSPSRATGSGKRRSASTTTGRTASARSGTTKSKKPTRAKSSSSRRHPAKAA